MNKEKAQEILKEYITKSGGISNLSNYAWYMKGDNHITLDGSFTGEELEAMAYWIKYNE